MNGRTLRLHATAAAIALGTLACSAERTPTDPFTPPGAPNPNDRGPLRYVSGTGQSATVGDVLDSAFVVRVFDSAGAPVPGGAVAFAVVLGGGTLSSSSVTSLADGSARMAFTVDTVAGNSVVRASYGGAEVDFTVRAVARTAAHRASADGGR